MHRSSRFVRAVRETVEFVKSRTSNDMTLSVRSAKLLRLTGLR